MFEAKVSELEKAEESLYSLMRTVSMGISSVGSANGLFIESSDGLWSFETARQSCHIEQQLRLLKECVSSVIVDVVHAREDLCDGLVTWRDSVLSTIGASAGAPDRVCYQDDSEVVSHCRYASSCIGETKSAISDVYAAMAGLEGADSLRAVLGSLEQALQRQDEQVNQLWLFFESFANHVEDFESEYSGRFEEHSRVSPNAVKVARVAMEERFGQTNYGAFAGVINGCKNGFAKETSAYSQLSFKSVKTVLNLVGKPLAEWDKGMWSFPNMTEWFKKASESFGWAIPHEYKNVGALFSDFGATRNAASLGGVLKGTGRVLGWACDIITLSSMPNDIATAYHTAMGTNLDRTNAAMEAFGNDLVKFAVPKLCTITGAAFGGCLGALVGTACGEYASFFLDGAFSSAGKSDQAIRDQNTANALMTDDPYKRVTDSASVYAAASGVNRSGVGDVSTSYIPKVNGADTGTVGVRNGEIHAATKSNCCEGASK